GDLAGGGRLLAVLDGQGEEVDALAGGAVGDGGDEHHRVAVADDDGAVGLLGELTRLDRQLLAAELDALFDIHGNSLLPARGAARFARGRAFASPRDRHGRRDARARKRERRAGTRGRRR